MCIILLSHILHAPFRALHSAALCGGFRFVSLPFLCTESSVPFARGNICRALPFLLHLGTDGEVNMTVSPPERKVKSPAELGYG